MSATEIVMDPNAPTDMKDEARLALERDTGAIRAEDTDLASAGSDKPGVYDDHEAVDRVINTGRRTGV